MSSINGRSMRERDFSVSSEFGVETSIIISFYWKSNIIQNEIGNSVYCCRTLHRSTIDASGIRLVFGHPSRAKCSILEFIINWKYSTDDICKKPPTEGEISKWCDILVRRWTFNHAKGKCESVNDRMCSRTENNFETEEECQKRCGGA